MLNRKSRAVPFEATPDWLNFTGFPCASYNSTYGARDEPAAVAAVRITPVSPPFIATENVCRFTGAAIVDCATVPQLRDAPPHGRLRVVIESANLPPRF